MDTRRRLGISNAPIVIGVVGALLLAVIITAVIVVYAVSGGVGGR